MKTNKTPLFIALPLFLLSSIFAEQGSAKKVAFLGILATKIQPALKEQMNLERNAGLLIEQVVADSPAKDTGLQRGDILHSVDGQFLFNEQQLVSLIRSYQPTETVVLDILRNGDKLSLNAVLGEREVKRSKSCQMGFRYPHKDNTQIQGLPNMHNFLKQHQGLFSNPLSSANIFNNLKDALEQMGPGTHSEMKFFYKDGDVEKSYHLQSDGESTTFRDSDGKEIQPKSEENVKSMKLNLKGGMPM
jgi:hypothetical protein